MNQRQSWKWDAEAAFEKIAAHEEGRSWCSNGDLDKKAMAAPYAPPPNVAAWLKAQADKPKPHGRDIESLMRYHKAHERDIGYWEDAPRGMKFAQDSTCPKCGNMMVAGHYCSTGGATAFTTTPPADGTYEPVGTMPVVGDECVKVSHIQIAVGEHIEVDVGSRITITGPKRDSPFGEVFDHDRNMSGIYAECFKRGSWRILKRPTKPRDDVATGARVWKWKGVRRCPNGCYVDVGGVMYYKERETFWRRSCAQNADRADAARHIELHGPERDALIAECRKAMGI